jgi:hypothetical protein
MPTHAVKHEHESRIIRHYNRCPVLIIVTVTES